MTTTSSTTYTLNDGISNYKSVALVIIPASNNYQILASTFVASTLFQTYGLQVDYRGTYNCTCVYKSDTSINGWVTTSGQIGVLYGIK